MIGKAGIGVLIALSTAMASSPDASKKEDRAPGLVQDVCTACHTLDRVRIQQLNKDEWTGLIKGMISEGSVVTDEEMDLIVDYLSRHFGYRDKTKDKNE